MTYDVGFIIDGLILIFLCVTIFYAARLSLFLKGFREGKQGMQNLITDLNQAIDRSQQAINGMKKDTANHAEALEEVMNEAKFLSDELRFMNQSGDSLANRLEKLADRNRELVDLIENAGGLGRDTVGYDRVSEHTEKSRRHNQTKRTSQNEIDAHEQSRTYERDYNDVDDIFEISDFEIDADDERDFWALSDGAYREEEIAQQNGETPQKDKGPTKSKAPAGFAIFDKELMEAAERELDEAHFSIMDSEHDDDNVFSSQAERDLYEALQRKKRVSEVS